MGKKFLVRTDQQSLKYLLEQRVIGTEYQKWVSKLMGLDFDIEYKCGASNRVADALSRQTDVADLQVLVTTEWPLWPEIQQEIAADPFLVQLRADLQSGQHQHHGFTILDGSLYYKNRLVIPKKSNSILQILDAFHKSPIGGHSGELKTYKRIAAELFMKLATHFTHRVINNPLDGICDSFRDRFQN